MKIVFIVLLIAAIGAGVYFYFSKKQKTHAANSRELILGTWKLDSVTDNTGDFAQNGLSLALLDSSEFEFRRDTLIFESLNRKFKDTTQYKFTDDKNLTLWKNADSVKQKWAIARLDSISLVLKDSDSASFLLRRVKQ